MTTYYVSAELSRYLEANGGKEFLAKIIAEHRDGDCREVAPPPLPVALHCPHCGIFQSRPTAVCWHCGKAIT